MSKKEINRYDLISRVIRKEITAQKAGDLIGLSKRQIKRLKKKVKTYGPTGLIHGNRGQPSNNKIPKKESAKIRMLLHKHYADFKPIFATEKLSELHAISRDPKTIRSIMIVEKLWTPRKGKKWEEHRSWRPRKECFGEMIQFDGSYHDWFEGRGATSEQCLLAAIDDATGTVIEAVFAPHEGVMPVLGFWKRYTLSHGKPRSIYLDKFSTYKMNQQVAIENPDLKTQFQRACESLGIQLIFANSPQAKGRVERLFETLQDRFVKELRLKGISDIEEANKFLREEYLPTFNARFSVPPVSSANLHHPIAPYEKKNLDSIFSRHTKRTIQNDFTFSFNNQWYQLTERQPLTVRKKEIVTVEEYLDGMIHMCLRGKELNYCVLPMRPKRARVDSWVLATSITRVSRKPAADHPWRRFHIQKHSIHS